jgi:hypothetical protein
VFACEAIALHLDTTGILEFRTSASSNLEKRTNKCNTFVHIYAAAWLLTALVLSIGFAFKENNVDEKYKVFTADGS